MKLCIADPPYIGRGRRLYGEGASNRAFDSGMRRKQSTAAGWTNGDNHPAADDWDDPATHQSMVARLVADYDGWVIALAWDNLRHYMQWVPADVWLAIWVKSGNAPPSRSRLYNPWEPVIVSPPKSRRVVTGPGTAVRGVLTAGAPGHFVGAKPGAWTRWVLDMLGYDPELTPRQRRCLTMRHGYVTVIPCRQSCPPSVESPNCPPSVGALRISQYPGDCVNSPGA